MKRLYYVGVIETKDEDMFTIKQWAFAGGYETEQQAFDVCGDNILAFINVVPMNEPFDESKWETDQNKLGYYPAREPERLGELTKRKL